ncbi:tetratricopeptide repeat protein [Desulfonatronovibrio hydrogenovorans]|uniref:tetratricopeptide repeat protein n=1 Tax=Desulfonatronovibrio hydrogenovorans TaxID=53245 RepID=UPI00048F022E|nr:tetratricopeptide repeat protein [Desulfonatronovibrio hydrogenovorans]
MVLDSFSDNRVCEMIRSLLLLCLILVLAGCAYGTARDTGVSREQISIRLELAERYLIDSEPRMALEQLRIVQDLAPDDPRLYFSLGLTHTVLDDLDKAAQAYERAVAIAPDFGEAWNNLGQVQQARGEFGAARSAFEQALDLEEYMTPEFAAYNLASLYAMQGKLDQALAWSRLGMEKNRRYTPLYEQTADFLQRTGRHQEALETLQAGVSVRPDSSRLRLRLAEALLSLGRDQDAKNAFAQIIEQDPRSHEAKTAVHYLEILR